MRQAPPVDVTLSGGGAWRASGPLLALLAAAAAADWGLARLVMPFELRFPVDLAAAAGAALLAWRLGRPRPRRLQWDGHRWTLDGTPGELAVMWDLGGWLLLRHRPAAGAAAWLPVPAREAGAAWHGLRAAVYARGATPAAPGAEA